MAISADLFSTLGGATNDLFGAAGSFASKSALNKSAVYYDKAAEFSDLNAKLAEQETGVKQHMADRELYSTLGGQQADFAGAGFVNSGSALDLLRNSAQEGALTRQLIGRQGLITEEGYRQEAAGYRIQADATRAEAKAAGRKGAAGIVGGVLKLATAGLMFFSDSRLKDVGERVGETPDGIGIFRFSYKDDSAVYEGVLAEEVYEKRPDAVTTDLGYLKVDYDLLGVELKKVA